MFPLVHCEISRLLFSAQGISDGCISNINDFVEKIDILYSSGDLRFVLM
jgi:hypothetical protein